MEGLRNHAGWAVAGGSQVAESTMLPGCSEVGADVASRGDGRAGHTDGAQGSCTGEGAADFWAWVGNVVGRRMEGG